MNSGILQDLVDLKKSDHGASAMPWGTIHAFPTESNMVNQTRFKDSAFALALSTVWDGNKKVLRLRRRPKVTATHAQTSRVPFGNQATKHLWIPQLYDAYNHNMGAVDLGDQLHAHNKGERRLRRGPVQGPMQFMLLVVLSNCFLICCHFDYDGKLSVDLSSQDDLRIQLVESLMAMGKDAPGTRKRRNSSISGDQIEVPLHRHELIKMPTRADCTSCKGGRIWDRPRKRVALQDIALNEGRKSRRNASWYGCKQCQLWFCDNSECFHRYHCRQLIIWYFRGVEQLKFSEVRLI